jgi:hypothetical protein
VSVEVAEDDVKLAVWKSRGDAFYEVEKRDAATPFRMSSTIEASSAPSHSFRGRLSWVIISYF